jgi:hypothetical protein
MSDPNLKTEVEQTREDVTDGAVGGDKPAWETPQMQDVSEEVMAQPYIRFT